MVTPPPKEELHDHLQLYDSYVVCTGASLDIEEAVHHRLSMQELMTQLMRKAMTEGSVELLFLNPKSSKRSKDAGSPL